VRPAGGVPFARGVDVGVRQRLTLSATSAASAITASTIGDIEATPDLFCYALRSTRSSGPTAVFNWGRDSFGESKSVQLANQAPFTRKTGLDIRVVNQTTISCGNACLSGFGIAFAQAVAAWRGGCERCSPNALTVLRLGGRVWLDSRAAGRLRRVAAGEVGVPLDLRKPQPEELEGLIAAPTMSVPQTSVVGYSEVTGDAAVRRALCVQAASTAAWVVTAQSMLCAGTPAAGDTLTTPTVLLKPGATRCGPDAIACGLPNAGIEITLDQIRYRIRAPTGVIFLGTATNGPAIDLRQVVLHEVGHWFGVPHSQVQGPGAVLDIMGETLGDGPACISAASMMMMNNASDLRWRYRISEGGGLKRPRSERN